MALRSRGKEVTTKIYVAGPRAGSFNLEVSSTVKPRMEHTTTQFNGRKGETIDVNMMGWEGELEFHESDAVHDDVLDSIVAAEENGTAQPIQSITRTTTYRGGGSRTYNYIGVVLIGDGEDGQGSDFKSRKWKWMAEKRRQIA